MVTTHKIERQSVKFPVKRFQQGGRIAYSLVMDMGTFDDCMPSDVDPKQIKDANRRFNESYSRNIEKYLYGTRDWVLGAILLGFDPAYSKFEPFLEEDGQASDSLGVLYIYLGGGTSSLKILDGQHRRKAIQRVRARLHQEIQDERKSARENGRANRPNKRLENLESRFRTFDDMAIPVIIYEEADTTNLRRMFSDLAEHRPIDKATKTRFDDRDPFNLAAIDLVGVDGKPANSEILIGRVEIERSTPLRNSENLLSLNQLVRCLKILRYGYGGRSSRERILEARQELGKIVDEGIAWTDVFLPSARKEYEALCSFELEDGYVAANRPHTLEYSATVLQLLAGCIFEWNQRNVLEVELEEWLRSEDNELAEWLRSADFDPNSEGCVFRKSGGLFPGDTFHQSSRQSVKASINYIVDEAMKANGNA